MPASQPPLTTTTSCPGGGVFPCVSIVRRKHGKKPTCGALLRCRGTRSRVFRRDSQKPPFFFGVVGPRLSLAFRRDEQKPRVFLTHFFAFFFAFVPNRSCSRASDKMMKVSESDELSAFWRRKCATLVDFGVEAQTVHHFRKVRLHFGGAF